MAVERGEVLNQFQFQIQDTEQLPNGVFQRVPQVGCGPHVPHQIFNVCASNDVHVGDVYNLTINRIVPIETRRSASVDGGSASEQENDFADDECVRSSHKLHRQSGVPGGLCFSEYCAISRRCGILWGLATVTVVLILGLVTVLPLALRDEEEEDTHISINDTRPLPLLPANCGALGHGTNDSVLDQYPWLAKIEFETHDTVPRKKFFTCSGSLINSRYVLTSGGCAGLPPKSVVHVRLGACIKNESSTDEECYFGVAEKILHPGWSGRLRLNDIALLRLDGEVNFTREIQPACLPEDPFSIKSLGGEVLFSAGLSFTPLGHPSGLMEEPVTVHGLEECSKYKKSQFVIDETLQICATPLESTVCCCITGGALMRPHISADGSSRSYLTGIMSYRSTICDEIDIPSEYTRVDAYMQWILDTIQP